MLLTEIKKYPLISIPFLKKRLRRITSLGVRNLTVNEINFKVHFTLHQNEKTVAFYTSETVENQRSPEWSFFTFPPHVQFLQDFLMRVWITSMNNCRLFLEYDIHLDDTLIPDEQKDDSYRNSNSLWIEMFGYRFTDNESIINSSKPIQSIDTRLIISEKKSKRNHSIKSYNQSSFLKLISLTNNIREKHHESILCLEDLQKYFDINQDYLSKIKERESRQVRIANYKQHLLIQTSLYERRLNSNQYRQKDINERKNQLEQNLFQLLNQQEELNSLVNHLNQSKCLLHDILQLMNFRRKYIISEIYRHIYPIIRHDNNEYSIADIKLPPAEDKIYQTSLTREREYEIEAAVGYCAHIVLLISQFIQLPLRFPIEYYGTSLIKIYDYNAQTIDFPLYPTYDPNTFQYGLYLLNRNIGQIMNHCHVGHSRTGQKPDYRKTLENLKELMEQYFLNINKKPSIQLYALNQQSIELPIQSNNNNNIEQILMRNKRTSISNSLFSPTRSAISSVIETNDEEQNDENYNNNDVDLFPTLNTISPRLIMQFSQQQ